jgi:hypothetical protein
LGFLGLFYYKWEKPKWVRMWSGRAYKSNFFIHEGGSLSSQNEKFGLRVFFTSPIFSSMRTDPFSHKRRNLDFRGFFTSPIFSSMRGKGREGGGERKKGGELDAAMVIKYNPFILSLSWIQFLLILHDPRVP